MIRSHRCCGSTFRDRNPVSRSADCQTSCLWSYAMSVPATSHTNLAALPASTANLSNSNAEVTPWTTLTFEIECRDTSRTAATTHAVSLDATWGVTCPHDIEAEKVARAFGSDLSCIALVEQAIPAVRLAMPVLTREDPVELETLQNRGSHWAPLKRVAACCGFEFNDARQAAAHVRSAPHIAQSSGAQLWQVKAVLDAVTRWISPDPTLLNAAANVVLETDGADQLWDAGIHPRRVTEMADWVSADSHPLPVSFFVGMTFLAPQLLGPNATSGRSRPR